MQAPAPSGFGRQGEAWDALPFRHALPLRSQDTEGWRAPFLPSAAPFSLLDRKGKGRKTLSCFPLTSVRRPSSVRSPVRSPPHIELAPVGGGALPGDFPSRGVLLSTQHSDAIFSNSFPSLQSTHHEVILIKRIIKKKNPRA